MTKKVWVNQLVEVTVDETKFTEEFLEGFHRYFYNFYDIEDHIEHLAQLEARGLSSQFIEGYGEAKENFGLDMKVVCQEEYIEDE